MYGSADLYASYKAVRVVSPDTKAITASVTIPWAMSSTWLEFGAIEDVTLSFVARSSADSPLRSTTSTNGYTIKQSYDMELTVEYASGQTMTQTGSFGTAEVKANVGTQYRNAKVRVFWLGTKNGAETVMNSDVKDLDSKGYISASIGNYEIGDKDEGGNFAIAYVEGGSGGASLTPGSTPSVPDASLGDPQAGASLGSPGSSGLSRSLNSSGLGSASTAKSTGLSTSGSTANGGANTSAAAVASTNTVTADGGAVEEALGIDSDEVTGEGWDSDAVALIVIVVATLALILRGLWRIFVVRARNEEADAEMPAMADQYSKGITF